MSLWTPQQLHALWDEIGGADSKWVAMVSIALAESGGNSAAESPSSDYGLWQINAINFPRLGLTVAKALIPFYSAVAAKVMSGNGTNVAAWCTAWADPDANCGRGFLAFPQEGSAAWRFVPELTGMGGAPPPPDQGGSAPVDAQAPASDGWAAWQNFCGPWGARQRGSYNYVKSRVDGLFQ